MSAWGTAGRRTELGPHQLAALERVVAVRPDVVRGHGRAGEAPQRAFNHDADRLARRVALEINQAREMDART